MRKFIYNFNEILTDDVIFLTITVGVASLETALDGTIRECFGCGHHLQCVLP